MLIALTVFTSVPDRDELRSQIHSLFEEVPPTVGIVAQPPDGPRRFALEATTAAPGEIVEPRSHGGIDYAVVDGRVHCRGIESDPALTDPAEQAADAFEKMESLLRHEGLTFGHVVRQWAYIENMLDCSSGRQAYQAFNDVRAEVYDRCQFPNGYPAATGIGQTAGGVVLDFIASHSLADVAPLSNPLQTDAHRYSDDMLVGTAVATPKFERAKTVARGDEEVIFVSGTAAIVGEQSVAPGNIGVQTRTTIDNIAALIGDRRLSRLRAYVKHTRDIPAVRRLCTRSFGAIPAVYVQADVCRDELLVELEGILVRKKEP